MINATNEVTVPLTVAWTALQAESFQLFMLFYRAKTDFAILLTGQQADRTTFKSIAADLKKIGERFEQLSFRLSQLRKTLNDHAPEPEKRKRKTDHLHDKDAFQKIHHLETMYRQCPIGEGTRLYAALMLDTLRPERMDAHMKAGLEMSFSEADIWVRHTLTDLNTFILAAEPHVALRYPPLYPPS